MKIAIALTLVLALASCGFVRQVQEGYKNNGVVGAIHGGATWVSVQCQKADGREITLLANAAAGVGGLSADLEKVREWRRARCDEADAILPDETAIDGDQVEDISS